VVPRSRRFGDAVDDHQIGFSRRLHASGSITLVEDADDLRAVLTSLVGGRERAGGGGGVPGGGALVRDLREYLTSTVRPAIPVTEPK
jgi:hypothetical protein